MPNAGRAEAEHNQAQSVQQIIRSGWGMVRCTLLEAIRAQPQRTPDGGELSPASTKLSDHAMSFDNNGRQTGFADSLRAGRLLMIRAEFSALHVTGGVRV